MTARGLNVARAAWFTFGHWPALAEAGVEPIKGKEPRHFALAMGLSPATVKKRSKPKRKPD